MLLEAHKPPTRSSAPDERGVALMWRAALVAVCVVSTVYGVCTVSSATPTRTSAPTDLSAHGVAHLTLGSGVSGATLSSSTDSLHHQTWVAARTEVVAVDELTGTVATMATGHTGYIERIAVDTVAGTAYASLTDDWGQSFILPISISSHRVGTPIAVPGGVAALTVDESLRTVIAVGSGDSGSGCSGSGCAGTMSFIDEQTGRVIRTAKVGRDPESVALDESAGLVYTADEASDTVSVVQESSGTVIAALPVGEEPLGVTVDGASHRAYVSSFRSRSVSVIGNWSSPLGGLPTFAIVATVLIGGAPWGIAADSVSHLVYVVGGATGEATLIDGISSTVVETVAADPASGAGQPIQVSVDEGLHTAYVVSRGGSTLDVVAPSIGMPDVDPRDARVGSRYSFGLSAVAAPAARVTLTAGALPDGLALDSATGLLSGTPTKAGSYSFAITANNGISPPTTHTYTLRVSPVCRLGWCS